ncbi:hypothetical protein AAFC00_005423 [Neodothiora populina]|uniref:Zn(2)-C6 fungal-type domain-containing protein n=1 Tax=Neodothiora populina TaxID=2781224 RepID=A0ABR3PLW8_9PEZI
MVLETPLLRVSRPVAACSRCRAAKIKCDGKLPSCTSCERAGKASDCSSTNDQFARGKERSYVSTLETKIERLERRIQEAKQRKSSVISMSDQDTTPGELEAAQAIIPPPAGETKAAKRQERLQIDDLVSDFGFLSVSATARDFAYGFTGTVSYAQLILSACNRDPLPQVIHQPLPPRNEATQIIQHYYDNFFILYPLFQETSFFLSFDAVYSNREGVATPFDRFMVRMVLGIAHAGRLEQRGDSNYMAAVGHVSAALREAEHVLRPGSIQSIQAMLLLHEYAMIDPHHFDSWSLIGAASRAMVDIGLHQDPPKGTHMPRSKLELRRRVFWCVYAFDRSTSLVQTRAFSFSDDSSNVSMPFTAAHSAARKQGQLSKTIDSITLKTLDTAPELFKLRTLQSAWYAELFQSGREPWQDPYPSIWRICLSMKVWWDHLPTTISQHLRSFLELNLLYSYIYVLAPSPRVPNVAPFAQALIFEYAIQYSEKMTTHVENRKHAAPISFYDAMRAYMTGRQFIEVLQNNQDRLLSGLMPDLPHVPLDSAPPPPVPSTPRDVQTNIARSISCLKKFTDCLSIFGMRWGYMSWRDRFQADSEDLLQDLNRRSWELQGTTSLPGQSSGRPSYQHEGSFGQDSLGTPSPFGQLYSSPTNIHPVATPTYPPDLHQIHSHDPGQSVPSSQYTQASSQQNIILPSAPPAQQFASWSGLSAVNSAQIMTTAHHDSSVSPPLDTYRGA